MNLPLAPRRTPQLLLASLAATLSLSAHAVVDVGVGVTINEPGVYGRIEFGTAPPPPVLYPRPVVIAPPPYGAGRQPIYLYVPPGHAKDWGKHCKHYNACNQPVYFVREDWVNDRYQRAHPGQGKGAANGKGNGKGNGNGKP